MRLSVVLEGRYKGYKYSKIVKHFQVLDWPQFVRRPDAQILVNVGAVNPRLQLLC